MVDAQGTPMPMPAAGSASDELRRLIEILRDAAEPGEGRMEHQMERLSTGRGPAGD
jgi:hypothetical protein